MNNDPRDSIAAPPWSDEDLVRTGAFDPENEHEAPPQDSAPRSSTEWSQGHAEGAPSPHEAPAVKDDEGAKAGGGLYNPPTKSHLAQVRTPHDQQSARIEISSPPVSADGDQPACIVPPTIDGFTRCRLTEWAPDRASPSMRRLLARLREPLTIEQERDYRRTGGRSVWLPLSAPVPTDPSGPRRAMAAVTVSGVRRQTVTMHVEKHIFVTFHCDAGIIDVQFKAGALWALGAGTEGFRRSASFWLRELSLLFLDGEAREHAQACVEGDAGSSRTLLDRHPKSPSGCSWARVMGWKMTGVEQCSDHTGLTFRRDDARSFVGIKQTGNIEAEAPATQVFGSSADRAETITVGTRSSPVSVCLYDKTLQVEKAKGGDKSQYEAAWLAGGWDGKADIQRVEMRMSGVGLRMERRDTGEVMDLTDPASVANAEKMATAWSWVTFRKRLVIRGSSERATRCKVDPRWSRIQECAEGADLAALGQWRQSRQVQADCWATAAERSRRGAVQHLARMAALHGRTASEEDIQAANGPANDRGSLDAKSKARVRVADHTRSALMEAAFFAVGNASLDDVGTYQFKYRQQWEPFIGEEIRAGARLWTSTVGDVMAKHRKALDEQREREEQEAVAE